MSRPERASARRYARAVLAAMSEQGPELAGRLRSDLRSLADLVSGHPELRAALEDPRVRPEQRRGILDAVAETMKLATPSRRLVTLLAERDLISLLPALAEAYAEEWNARQGIVGAEATGAVSLTRTQQRDLEGALARASGHEVELRSRVDPDVIGGLRVKLGDTLYDGSVRAQLAALRRRLAGGH